jgi:Flp pilus assembly pilin Flp
VALPRADGGDVMRVPPIRDLGRLGARCLGDLVTQEDGQDLVEHALLLAFFGVAALAAWTSISTAIGANLSATSAGLDGLWDPPPPGGSP